VPIALGIFLVPRLPKLFERFPGLSIELVIRDNPFDLVEERLDLAIHRGPISDTSLMVRASPCCLTSAYSTIKAGRLRRLLGGHEAPGDPSRRHLAPRTRAVIDFLLEQAREVERQL